MSTAVLSRTDAPTTTYDTAAIMGGLYGDGIIASRAPSRASWVAATARGHRGAVRRGAARARAARVGRGPEALLRGGPSGAAARLRRPGDPSVGASPCARPCSARTTRSSRSASTCPVAGRACTSRGTATSRRRRRRWPGRRLNSLAFNLTDRRRDRGHGPVRDRARHAVGRPGGLRARDVPAEVALPALRGARAAQAAEDGRHLGPLGAHDPPRHGQPLATSRARCSCSASTRRTRATPSGTTCR